MKSSKFLIFYILLFLYSFANADDIDKYNARIAVVDVESILENSIAVKNIKDTINLLGKSIEQEVLAKEEEFKIQEKLLLLQKDKIKKEQFDILVAEFGESVSIAQKIMQSKKVALEQAYSEAIEKVHQATISVISDLSQNNNFNVVVPSNQVLFVTNDLNITLEVITSLNEKLQTVPIDYTKFMK